MGVTLKEKNKMIDAAIVGSGLIALAIGSLITTGYLAKIETAKSLSANQRRHH
jgi:hypothetical protein